MTKEELRRRLLELRDYAVDGWRERAPDEPGELARIQETVTVLDYALDQILPSEDLPPERVQGFLGHHD